MPSTNGHGHRRAILYARVSGDEQAKKGYSLSDQSDALRKWAAAEGYEVLEEVADEGWSGAYLERPGLDRVRDLVQEGGVSAVAVLFRDRLARGVYAQLLKDEFARHGARMIALNAQVDDSPEGDLQGGILDQFAAYERAKIAERTRRGKLQKARKGKLVATAAPNYGYRYNEAHDNYVVDEEEIQLVRRIVYMVGVEGKTIHGVKVAFEREKIPTPTGGRYWNEPFIRKCIMDDVYKPHSYDEIKALVSPEATENLKPDRLYGVRWFNRYQRKSTQIAEDAPDGRRYRRRSKTTQRPREQWIAIPVPDAGIPRAVVDAARDAIRNNRPTSSAGRRFWELSGGVLRCGGCGRAMQPHAVTGRNKNRRYFYYRCPKILKTGKDACANDKGIRAEEVEQRVWAFVSGWFSEPESLLADLDRAIERERSRLRGDPDGEARMWLDKLAEVDRRRERAQDLAIQGLLDVDELRGKLANLKETREAAQRELSACRSRSERMETLQRERDHVARLIRQPPQHAPDSVAYAIEETDLLMRSEHDPEAMAEYVARNSLRARPDALAQTTPEKRHRLYKAHQLRAVVIPGGEVQVSGVRFLESETLPGTGSGATGTGTRGSGKARFR